MSAFIQNTPVNTATVIIIALLAITLAGIIGFCLGLYGKRLNSISRVYLKNMKNHLAALRAQEPGHSAYGEYFVRDVARGKISWEELGTTEEEVSRLAKRLHHKECAESLLNSLRNGTQDFQRCIILLRENVDEGGLTLDEIGTNEDEIAAFPKENVKKVAQYWTNHARSELTRFEASRTWIVWALKTKLVNPSDIGLNTDEMKRFGLAALDAR
jgi:hypothetical protein